MIAFKYFACGEINNNNKLDDQRKKSIVKKKIDLVGTSMIEFIIHGKPIPQARHRDCKGSKRKYDPCQSEKTVFLINSMRYAPKEPIDFPIRLDIDFYLPRPKDHYETRKTIKGQLKQRMPKWYTSKPDLDNIAKFVKDALNGVFWTDDSFVCDGRFRKMYSTNPRTEITIMECE